MCVCVYNVKLCKKNGTQPHHQQHIVLKELLIKTLDGFVFFFNVNMSGGPPHHPHSRQSPAAANAAAAAAAAAWNHHLQVSFYFPILLYRQPTLINTNFRKDNELIENVFGFVN